MKHYFTDLTPYQKLYLESQETQTIITLTTSTPQQQQSQSLSWQTGAWIVPPILWQSNLGFILRVEGERGQFSGLIQGNSITDLQQMPSIANAQVIPLHPITADTIPNPASTFPSMPPLPPLQPMSPMSPMRMQMGSMQMHMGGGTSPNHHFCSQCGTQVQDSDRFCANCGYALKNS
jgi:hypothetical protein